MMFLGVDAGSAYIKFAFLDNRFHVKRVCTYVNVGNGFKSINTRIRCFLSNTHQSAATTKIGVCGYGSKNVHNPEIAISEITAVAKGVSLAHRNIGCIIDIGAQDYKVIKIEPRSGKVLQFYMNDKCASGTGVFIDMMRRRLGIPFNKIDSYCIKGKGRIKLSTACTVFATSELIGHLANNEPIDSLLRGAIDVLVRKISPLVERFNGVKNFTLTGGLSNTKGIANAFSEALKLTYKPLQNSNYMGAIGAAYLAGIKRHREEQISRKDVHER
jgi:predicted CoA-substrate-specific enzyme activase